MSVAALSQNGSKGNRAWVWNIKPSVAGIEKQQSILSLFKCDFPRPKLTLRISKFSNKTELYRECTDRDLDDKTCPLCLIKQTIVDPLGSMFAGEDTL